jgi:dipeptidyl aminopeptidase/acylaminoacyl peptidase
MVPREDIATTILDEFRSRRGRKAFCCRFRYRENSPLFSFDRIDTPLLIGQIDKDGRLISSDAVFVGLQRLGKKVEHRIYENEGHVIARKANVLDFW